MPFVYSLDTKEVFLVLCDDDVFGLWDGLAYLFSHLQDFISWFLDVVYLTSE